VGLQHLALHDALTGLPNRVLFADRLERAISLAKRREGTVAVFVIDINRFKQVNDVLGHAHGDLVLRAVADRLSDAIRDCDTAARIGGDEFAVLAPDIDRAGAAILARRLRDRLRRPYVCGEHEFRDGASVGLSLFPDDGGSFDRTLDAIVTEADVAMYRAKRRRIRRMRTRRPPVVMRRH
jgi:diguanylate cyclase (GGDEF)-like protein